jgi:hypothetical protein
MKYGMRQKEENSNNNKASQSHSQILEQGDIFFFYRPKIRSEEVRGIEDIRRFFMVLAPEDRKLYSLFVIGNSFIESKKLH